MGKRSISKNSFYSICYKLVGVLFPLIISSYSSHILMPTGVGKVALAQNITTYFVTISALGIPNYGTKKIGSIQNNTDEKNKVFTELFVINLVSTIICAVVFFIMIFNIPYFKGNELYIVFSMLILFNIANVDWLYQGLEEYKYIAVRSIIVKLACLIILPILVRDENDIFQYAFILCISTVGNYVFNIIYLRKFVCFTTKNLNFKRHLKYIFILLASVCATEIYTMLDSTMVGVMCSETDLGYYTNASKTARMLYVLITAACAVYLPRLSLYWKENRRNEFENLASQGMKLVLILSIPIFCGAEVLADRIIPVLFGKEFTSSIFTLRILAILVIIFSVAYIGGHVILIASNREKYTMYAAIAGAISNFTLNLILIRVIGFNGAAIASVFAETIVTVVLILSARPAVNYHIKAHFYISTFVSCFGMTLVVLMLKRIIQDQLLSCVVCTILGGIIYFIFQYLLKNDVVISLVLKIRNRIKFC